MKKQWFDRPLTDYERLVLENQHIMLYWMRNTSPNDILFQTLQDQMSLTRNHLDNDLRMKQNDKESTN